MINAMRRARLLVVGAAMVAAAGCHPESLIKQQELMIIPGLPAGWTGTANTSGIGTTVTEVHGGRTAAYLSGAFDVLTLNSFTLVQYLRADNYRGKRMQLTAWVKPRNVTNTVYSGIWMRVDGPGTMLAFDNMALRPVSGYGDWRQVSVVLDVPASAIGMAFGALFQASNTLLVDDFRLEEVSTAVPSTSTVTTPVTGTADSATTVANYAGKPLAPVNLGFEGLSTAPSFMDGPGSNRLAMPLASDGRRP